MEVDVMTMKQAIVTGLSAAGLILAGGLSWAAGQYGPGASDTEIKIGNTVPYTGPASAYGTIGKSEAAYFDMQRFIASSSLTGMRTQSFSDRGSPSKSAPSC
jgi:branched-chain amino acid transport system substrate-binding protein